MATPTPEDLHNTIIAEGIRDERLLQALLEIPRAGFVPPGAVDQAYVDRPIPIAHDQVTTQPSLTARMIEALQLTGDEHVLEIGTGLGFQTALLARLAEFVWSIERWADLAETARSNLAQHGFANVEVVTGDGTEGVPEQAPFDAVLISAAFHEVPSPLVAQLTDGGRLVQPIGPGGRDDVVMFEKEQGTLKRRRSITPAHFVKLYGTHGYRE